MIQKIIHLKTNFNVSQALHFSFSLSVQTTNVDSGGEKKIENDVS